MSEKFCLDIEPGLSPTLFLFLHGQSNSLERLISEAILSMNFEKIANCLNMPITTQTSTMYKKLLTNGLVAGCHTLEDKSGLWESYKKIIISSKSEIKGYESLTYMDIPLNVTRVQHKSNMVSILFETHLSNMYHVGLSELKKALEHKKEEDTWVTIPGSLTNLTERIGLMFTVPAKAEEYIYGKEYDKLDKKSIFLSDINDTVSYPAVEDFVRTVILKNETGCELPDKKTLQALSKSEPSKKSILISQDNTLVVISDKPGGSFGATRMWKINQGKFLLGTKDYGFINMGGTISGVKKNLLSGRLKPLLSNTKLNLVGYRLSEKDYNWNSQNLRSKLVMKQIKGEDRE